MKHLELPKFEKLFPGRDIEKEWKSRLDKNEMKPIYKLPFDFDLIRLKNEIELLKPKLLNEFEKSVVTDRYDVPADYHTRYYLKVFTHPTTLARQQQALVDEARKVRWTERQIGPKRTIRSLMTLNSDYDPLVDERNYTLLDPCLDGTYFQEVLKKFSGRVTRVRLGKLRGGEGLKPHSDTIPNYSIRAHIPIETNDYCMNFARQNGFNFAEHFELGQVYLINTGITHWAHNFGKSDRIHLVICLDGQEDLLKAVSL